jgi:hypothetical protein
MRMRTRIRQHRVSIAIALFGFGFFFSGEAYYRRYDWRPVFIPITKLGVITAAEFTADMNEPYRISIQFERNQDAEYWECVFGTTYRKEQCQTVPDSASVTWAILTGNKTLVSGIAAGPDRAAYWGNGYAGSKVADFPAEKGRTYRIEVLVQGPATLVQAARPRLKVEPPALVHKDTVVGSSLLELVALVLGGIAAVVFIFELALATERPNDPSNNI